jgi:hypothetical protein
MKQTQQREKSKRHKSENGRGHVYLQHGAWYLQYYQSEMRDGETVRVRRSVKLADKDREHGIATCEAVSAAQLLRGGSGVNARNSSVRGWAINVGTPAGTGRSETSTAH